MARKDSVVQEAQALVTEAGLFHSKGEYEEAARAAQQALSLLPDSPLTAELRLEARTIYASAAVGQARKMAASGRYNDARAQLKLVLSEGFDPDNAEAKALEAELDDPERYEPALTSLHADNVAQVEKELRLASGFITLGDYNSAISKYHEVLRIDPYNETARRGMQRAEQLKGIYYESARDHVRAKRLNEVNQMWEDLIPVTDVSSLFGNTANYGAVGGSTKENLLVKIRTMTIPLVDLQGASLEEVVEFLRIRSRELDPQKRGVDFVLKVTPEIAARPVTLSMVGVPIEEVLRYATEMTSTLYQADEYAITISSLAEKSTTLIGKTYRVPPDFLQNAPTNMPDPSTPVDPFGAAKPASAGLQIRRLSAREFLEQRGVIFPEGASASYVASTSLLSVRNTAENMALVDALVEEVSSASPKQIEIQVRLIEVNETRLQELGFDWLLGQFNVPGSNQVFASGGTIGNQRPGSFGTEEFPFVAPGANGSLLQFPVSPAPSGANPPIGVNPITSGLRSSGALFAVPSIDQLINQVTPQSVDTRSPGTFALAGVFTDPQFQTVIRTLSQSKGVDLITAPTIVTKSGQRANISLSREMRYPTEFDPPQVPQQVGGPVPIGGVLVQTEIPDVVPIPPSTPTAFETREVGITLEVEPVISENNRTIDLNLVPSSTEFQGFIDYGTDIPIPNRATGTVVNQQNDVLQPIFRTNKITTAVTIWDGNTIVLGGAMYDKRQNIDDKVPFLGDLPIIGRTFRSKVTQVEKKNVIFFVSVKVIDPGGNRINQGASTAAR